MPDEDDMEVAGDILRHVLDCSHYQRQSAALKQMFGPNAELKFASHGPRLDKVEGLGRARFRLHSHGVGFADVVISHASWEGGAAQSNATGPEAWTVTVVDTNIKNEGDLQAVIALFRGREGMNG